ncbi:MAG TPA: gluconate 2-dehydrogenase subunit 3 family protein [Gaiellales bacterium]|nr:gluconate 2-dehydrogenase subunit 3 family protein [Gaiellales bacterium]
MSRTQATDFSEAGHLPKVGDEGSADPAGLPRQRRGTTPQMHGRYPDFDVMQELDHWDERTRELIVSRVEAVPQRTFFTEQEFATLTALADLVLAQDREPRVPALAFVDAKLESGRGDGYRYDDMPDDRETWRTVARGLDEAAGEPFAEAPVELRERVVGALADGSLSGGAWAEVNVTRAYGIVMRDLLEAFYSHPWAWNEIGFGGPAYPRGYQALGVDRHEPWEGREAFELDPVRDVKERGLE